MITKTDLRKSVLEACSTHPLYWWGKASEHIITLLEGSSVFKSAQVVALYWSLENEVNTHSLLPKYYNKKKLLLPVMAGEHLVLKHFTGQNCLSAGKYGICEPTGKPFEKVEDIDLIIVPGIAFDRQGNRLGRGKGFYDRLLARTPAAKIGLCFDFQLFENIPIEIHDVRLDGVIAGSDIGAAFYPECQ